jgi:predicted RNA binding protein YcfA (HicA-like mRNA interferase family)
MGRREKLIARIRARPVKADFDDVRRLLEMSGYRMARQKGSHVSFTRPGMPTIVVPTAGGRKVKRPYLDRLCELLALDHEE